MCVRLFVVVGVFCLFVFCFYMFFVVLCVYVCVCCRYEKLLFADISAICGFKRLPHLNNLLANTVSTNMNF